MATEVMFIYRGKSPATIQPQSNGATLCLPAHRMSNDIYRKFMKDYSFGNYGNPFSDSNSIKEFY